MRVRRLSAVLGSISLVAVALAAPAAADRPADPGANGAAVAAAVRVCAAPPDGFASCHAIRNDAAQPSATGTPSGYGPADLQSAYALPSSTAGSGQTIAIVDAYDDPSAWNDLVVYRNQYYDSGTYPIQQCSVPFAAGSATPCFAKVNQSGGTTPPRANGSWAQEISLDLDMASAICPKCNILLVESSSNSFANLAAAVDRAALMGATAISNSYGGGEYSAEVTDQSHYNHPGIAVTVSSGDGGYGVEFPAASQYVTAVGGTHLTMASGVRAETAWSGAGSGCSAYISKPSWQTDTGCSRRTVADVSAVADPNTGVAVYDSTKYQGRGGWMVFGGTSVSAPIIAGVYALAGNANLVTYGSYPYTHMSALFDVTSGSNGSCSGSYLCTAGTGFDGPTGLGTPNGVGAF